MTLPLAGGDAAYAAEVERRRARRVPQATAIILSAVKLMSAMTPEGILARALRTFLSARAAVREERRGRSQHMG